jgi:hypothetical protein
MIHWPFATELLLIFMGALVLVLLGGISPTFLGLS